MIQQQLILIILLVSVRGWTLSQPAPLEVPVLGLQDVAKKGLDYSEELKKAQSQVRQAEDNTSKARGLLFPTINGKASATTHQNSTTFTSSSVPGTVSSGTGETYLVGLDFAQPLYAGGALTSGLSYYKAGEDLARQAFFSVKQTVLYNVLSAYYNLSLAQQLHDAAVSNREILKSYVEITNHYEHIGRSRKMDQLQSQVNYSLALADVESLQNSLNTTVSNLNKLLGESNDKFYRSNFTVTISPIANITLDQAYEAALKNNPDIRTAELKLEQVNYSEDLDLSLDKPSLSLAGSAGYQAPDKSTVFQSSSQYYTVGLNLVIPIFSGLSSLSKRNIYEEQKYQAKRDLQIAKDTLRNAIENALHSLKSSQTQLELAQTSVKQGRSALDMANKSYRQGIASSLDVVNLQNTRYSAEKLFVNSQFGYVQALLTLRQQMGIDLEKAYVH